MRRQVGAYSTIVQQMHAHMVHQQARADFDGLVGKANDQLKKWEIPVGEYFARHWLISVQLGGVKVPRNDSKMAPSESNAYCGKQTEKSKLN